jgi:hypothetical protein
MVCPITSLIYISLISFNASHICMIGSESVAITMKTRLCHETITMAQRFLNGPDLTNKEWILFFILVGSYHRHNGRTLPSHLWQGMWIHTWYITFTDWIFVKVLIHRPGIKLLCKNCTSTSIYFLPKIDQRISHCP